MRGGKARQLAVAYFFFPFLTTTASSVAGPARLVAQWPCRAHVSLVFSLRTSRRSRVFFSLFRVSQRFSSLSSLQLLALVALSAAQGRWSTGNWESEEVTACAGRSFPGTEILARLMISSFQGVWLGRTYGCTYMSPTRPARPPYRSGSLSDHASGAAVDVMLGRVGDASGRQMADWAMKNFEALGLKYVIYARQINTGNGWRRYTGTNPHIDHVHVSLLKRAARELTENDIRPLLEADNYVPGSNPGRGRGSGGGGGGRAPAPRRQRGGGRRLPARRPLRRRN